MGHYFWFWPLNFKKDVDEDTGEPGSVFYKESENGGTLPGKGKANSKENGHLRVVS